MRVIDDTVDFSKYENACPDAANVKPASAYADGVIELYHAPSGERGSLMPWSKTFEHFQFRPGEVTIWHGMNGHGKSMVQGFCTLSLMDQGERVCIFSAEMKPVRTLARMARQAAGCIPSPAFIRAFHAWTDDKLWMYDQQGTVKTRRIIGVIRYCRTELGVTHFVVDSLMKCGLKADDYNGQREFLDELTALARDLDMHIHLVAHSRKGDDEMSPPGKMDVAGSADITNQVDNVLNVWRNKRKEREKQKPNPAQDILDQADVLIMCDKQRNGDAEPLIKLWFDPKSYQYLAAPHDRTMDFFEFDAREWQQ